LWAYAGHRRKFFQNYAKQHGFDPLVPENWYKESRTKVLAAKGAATILQYHKNNLAKALQDLFPSIGIENSKIKSTSALLMEESARKKFFEEYAQQNSFNPLIPENWYAHLGKVQQAKGAKKVLQCYSQSLTKALFHLFPNIGLDRSLLAFRSIWREPASRRKFFEAYAAANGFDPNVAQNWYVQSSAKIMASKGAQGVTLYHKHSISQALVDLFPEVKWDRAKLTI